VSAPPYRLSWFRASPARLATFAAIRRASSGVTAAERRSGNTDELHLRSALQLRRIEVRQYLHDSNKYERPACSRRDRLPGNTANRHQLVPVTWPATPIQPDQKTRSRIRLADLTPMKRWFAFCIPFNEKPEDNKSNR
jgi:hypothetical protein